MKATEVFGAAKSFEEACAAASRCEHYHFLLFVTGGTPKSLRAIQNLKELCEDRLPGRYSFEIIDAYQNPHHLKLEQVVVTPTLIKQLPFPIKRIVGDLSDRQRFLVALE
jgi:circadian clock protein KaiB